ncbi:MAG TPA: carnitine dehydratase [Rhodospirillaceae bacterium]|nr:carnitine dehydratase [Candidatus Neomarinimicrobiota bacterium]HCX14192.1 carnitine dehydratase [Rhodospirillaceae bacterium]
MSKSKSSPTCGPLEGIKVVEMAAIGPVPFCGMALADMGAEVICVERVFDANLGIAVERKFDCMGRGKKSISVDLKQEQGVALVRHLISESDAVIEGFRPDVMDRLGLGPEICLAQNPRLVFGRSSGWGDEGPLSSIASHDINYLALSGCLASMGVKGPPTPPLNLVGDFGGAAMHLLAGVIAGLYAAKTTGVGQVVSASIAHGTLGLMPMIYGLYASGSLSLERGQNLLDGGAPFYRTYETSDGRYIAVGAIEKKFFIELLRKLGLEDRIDATQQNERNTWPQVTTLFEEIFAKKTRDEWSKLFANSDACVTPVLDMSEALQHPQQIAANAFIEIEGVRQPAPVPKFSASQHMPRGGAPEMGAHTGEILAQLGYSEAELAEFSQNGLIAGDLDQ